MRVQIKLRVQTSAQIRTNASMMSMIIIIKTIIREQGIEMIALEKEKWRAKREKNRRYREKKKIRNLYTGNDKNEG